LTDPPFSVSSKPKLEAESFPSKLEYFLPTGSPRPISARFIKIKDARRRNVREERNRPKKKEKPDMKKLTSALALVALATSLVACSKPEEKKPEVKAEAPKVVEETKTTSTSTTTTAPDATTATTATTTTTTTTTSTVPATAAAPSTAKK
jgi:hypothetical protein